MSFFVTPFFQSDETGEKRNQKKGGKKKNKKYCSSRRAVSSTYTSISDSLSIYIHMYVGNGHV
jgi:hypothetical protein